MTMKRKRRLEGKGYALTGTILFLILLMLGMFGWYALPTGKNPAAVVATTEMASLFQFSDPDPAPGESGADLVPDTEESQENLSPEEELYREVYSAVNAGQQTVKVNTQNEESLKSALLRILRRPEFFWLNGYSMQSMGDEYEIVFEWKYDDLETKRTQVEQEVQKILEMIPVNAGEYETALAIHDWLCENIVYEASSNGSDQDIYGALVNGKCVCAGYSAAYEYLLTRAGLLAETVRGTAKNSAGVLEGHAWSKVQLEGDTYYIDVTWDDSEEAYNHFWFGLTSDRMGATHFADESQGAAMTPSTAIACNFYYRNGMVLDLFSNEKLIELLRVQSGPEFYISAATQDTFEKVKAVFESGEIHALLEQAGHPSSNFQYSFSDGAWCVMFTLLS